MARTKKTDIGFPDGVIAEVKSRLEAAGDTVQVRRHLRALGVRLGHILNAFPAAVSVAKKRGRPKKK